MKFEHSKTDYYKAYCKLPVLDGSDDILVTAFHDPKRKMYCITISTKDGKFSKLIDLHQIDRKSEKSFNKILQIYSLIDRVVDFCQEYNLSIPKEWLKKNRAMDCYVPVLLNSEPAYFFEVGDKVGRDGTVVDYYENKKIYKVSYGVGIYEEIKIYFWYEIRPNCDNNKSSLIQNEDLKIDFQNRDIYGILLLHYTGGIDMNPDYQRELVWTNDDKIALIDSIFKNVDIGKFVMIQQPYEEDAPWYEILDGKQRLNALIEFYENRFSYKGYYYNDLSAKDRNHFKHYAIAWAECHEMTDEQKLKYFLKLNTGGTAVSKTHLRKIETMLAEKTLEGEKA